MAKFLNRKEQVYDLKLTNYGHYLLSIGQLEPIYYAFLDDNIIYDGKYAENTFGVANDFIFGIDDPVSLLIFTDKTEYHPGDVVLITGKSSKIIYVEAFDVSVIQKSGAEITCGSFVCENT